MTTSKISVNVIFLLRKKTYLCVKWLVKVKSRKEEKTKKWVGRCHTVDIKYSILVILSWFLAWIWPEWLSPIFVLSKLSKNRSRDTFLSVNIFWQQPIDGLLLLKKWKILSIPATEKLCTKKWTFTHGSNSVVINHPYPIYEHFLLNKI